VTSGGVVGNAYDEASRTATRNVELDANHNSAPDVGEIE